jgi:type III pantothenate kinase
MSPLLLIDVGNTRIKWATATTRGTIRMLGHAATTEVSSRWATALAKQYSTHQVVITSVVPAAAGKLRSAFGRRAIFVTAETSGLKFNYPKPGEIGADRLACAAAVQGPAIIAACGTATAFSVLDRHGTFCGGVIAPGLETQLTALLGRTAQLPTTSLRLVLRLPARSTQAAIQAGVLLNFQGGVREILQRLGRSGSDKPRVVLTGGYAHYLKEAGLGSVELRPLLVFEGLHIIGQRVFVRDV